MILNNIRIQFMKDYRNGERNMLKLNKTLMARLGELERIQTH